jgi:chromosome segregation ATPase
MPGKRPTSKSNQTSIPFEEIKDMIVKLADKFDNRFDKIESRIEKLDDKVEAVSKITDKNTIVLEEHQRRALGNEKHAALLEEKLDLQRQEYNQALKLHEEASASRDKELESKQRDLAESVEIFTKFPKHLYRIAKWLAAISAGGAAFYAILTAILSYMGK